MSDSRREKKGHHLMRRMLSQKTEGVLHWLHLYEHLSDNASATVYNLVISVLLEVCLSYVVMESARTWQTLAINPGNRL